MKRSRLICSIVTVISILISIFLVIILSKSSIDNKSNLNFNIKLMHILVLVVCMGLYVFVRNKLIKKTNNSKLINIYCYMFLAVIVFVSRLVMVYIITDPVKQFDVSLYNGLGSYINYYLGKLFGSSVYANIVINTVIVYVSSILIKKIILNITNNDFVSTFTSFMYILIPKSLITIKEYSRFGYNVLFILLGIYIFFKIIDLLKRFDNKSNEYIYLSICLGVVQALDIVLGGTYVFWIVTMILSVLVSTYIDITHIHFRDSFKSKLKLKYKVYVEKIEKINISKLVYVILISLAISLIPTVITSLISKINNYEMTNVITSIKENLIHSRNYYIVLIVVITVFDILGLILKRDIDTKMFLFKVAYITSICIIPFVLKNNYTSYVFDTILAINVIISMCNVCINNEGKIKLLKEKN